MMALAATHTTTAAAAVTTDSQHLRKTIRGVSKKQQLQPFLRERELGTGSHGGKNDKGKGKPEKGGGGGDSEDDYDGGKSKSNSKSPKSSGGGGSHSGDGGGGDSEDELPQGKDKDDSGKSNKSGGGKDSGDAASHKGKGKGKGNEHFEHGEVFRRDIPDIAISYVIPSTRSSEIPVDGDYNELSVVSEEFLDRSFQSVFEDMPVGHF
ncbi:MAG: hypothetical protein SGARI_006184, partial [Bacillariaceae sp.]